MLLMPSHRGQLLQVCCSACTSLALAVICTYTLLYGRMWDVGAGSCVHKVMFGCNIQSIAFQGEDNAHLIAGGDDGNVSVWLFADAKQVLNVPCHGSISSLTCNSRRNVVAAASPQSKQIYMIKMSLE